MKRQKYDLIFMLFIAIFGLPLSVMADITPTTRNSVTVKVPLVPITSNTELTTQNSVVQVQYSDGLGRPTMIVRKSIVNGKDLVRVYGYNAFGEVGSQWLPTPMINTTTIPDATVVMQNAKSFYGDQMPYSTITTSYQAGGKNTLQIGPGLKWHSANKSKQLGVTTSPQYADIKRYVVVGAAVKLLPESANLFTQQVKMTDENSKEVYNFVDNTGTLVMDRKVVGGSNHDTYYVYNDMGQLCFVLPPEASSRMTSTTATYNVAGPNTDGNPLSQYGYVYRYNAKGQCIAKKLPGKDWTYMVYDRGGRLAFSIDGNQHQTVTWKWTFYTYDAQNRLAQSGTTEFDTEQCPPNYDNQDAIVSYVSNGYTSPPIMGQNTRILTENYYDNYNFINKAFSQELKINLAYEVPSVDTRYYNTISGVDIATLGKLTGTMVAELKSSGAIFSAMYYDQGGHVIQLRSNNHMGGFDNDSYTYNFSGQVLTNNHKHTSPNMSISENYTYDYDSGGRLTAIHYLIPSKGNTKQGTVLMDSLVYDEVGRVKQKWIHAKIQTIDYTYNVRNQLKTITSSKFSEQLNYADDDPNSIATYNGNIASISYGAGATYKYKYSHTYDDMNRLTAANYTDLLNANNNGNYDEKFTTYDQNSNIKELTRSGLVKDFKNMQGTTPNIVKHDMDQLTMTYAGNQVQTITDGNLSREYASVGANDFSDKQSATQPTEYYYDANGNQTSDYNKGIAWIKYNLLNLPEKVQFCNGNKIEYNYYADGSKKQAIYHTTVNYHNIPIGETSTENFDISSTFTQDYCGRYIYENNQLKRVLTPEGYAKFNGTTTNYYWTYVYNLKDHLGNTRVSLESMPFPYYPFTTCYVRGTTDYYPSGMEIRPTSTNASGTNAYLYGGKELDRMHGFNEYDFSARWYDYATPTFTTMDPHAENHYAESPYSYCAGNPVNNVDPTGMDWYSYVSSNGKKFQWFEYEKRTSFEVTAQSGKVTYTNAGAEIYFKATDNYIYHGTSTGQVERLLPLPTVDVRPTLEYGYSGPVGGSSGGSNGTENQQSGKSDPNSHYGPDGCYNLYTQNETDAVMKFYTEVAVTALGGSALKALGKTLSSVGSKLLPAAVKLLSKTSVAVEATATRGAVYLGSSSGAAYVAGGVEGVVKSYYGGPDVEFGSSIFGNPISDAGMTISSNSWTLLGMPTYP